MYNTTVVSFTTGPHRYYRCPSVNKEGGDGEGTDSESLSDTFRYINLAGSSTGLLALRGPMHLCACVSEEGGDGEGADWCGGGRRERKPFF